MVCFTGDMHADFNRFGDKAIKKLKKVDTLVVCGDFGFIWSGNDEEEKILKKIGKRRHITAFVPGANENYELLSTYEEVDFFGGKALHIQGNLYCLLCGQVYTIDQKKILCLSGGEDLDARIAGKTIKEGQIPNLPLLQQCMEHLQDNYDNTIDYIVSYEPPFKLAEFMDLSHHLEDSFYPCYLDMVSKKLKFTNWFFGKYHRDKIIPPKYQAVFCKYYSVN